ncbi:hypothetical protein NDU88_002258 [Pleurodeles waltl]|uniref:Uncharacterized protein n=1 Tax=Pleurodeles waltl TaxID=8319 RepID=A0AAV7TL38_PLEWA|nr:hypothetical protein NDU88_002258 [Pleurodeles waltl]
MEEEGAESHTDLLMLYVFQSEPPEMKCTQGERRSSWKLLPEENEPEESRYKGMLGSRQRGMPQHLRRQPSGGLRLWASPAMESGFEEPAEMPESRPCSWRDVG